MRNISKQGRLNEILKLLENEIGISVKELSNRLGVTEMTIRRDIQQLRLDGIVKLVSGAIILNTDYTNSDSYYNLSLQKNKQLEQKVKIGKTAVDLIEPGDIVYFGIGTTIPSIIENIPPNTDITAVCCTMNALLTLNKKNIKDIILIGGKYIPELEVFESKEGIEFLKRTRITTAFISAAGVSSNLGVTCVNSSEVDIKSAVIKNALKKVLVVDSSKFGKIKPSFFASLMDFDIVITDNGISSEWKKIIGDNNIKLYIC